MAVLRPVNSIEPNCAQPPIFSGEPYLKRTLSPLTHWLSPPVDVTCLLNPGANFTFLTYNLYITKRPSLQMNI